MLEAEYGVALADQSSSRHLFFKQKQSDIEWPFPLNRDGLHCAPMIVLRIAERFNVSPVDLIASLRKRLRKQTA